MYNVYKYRLLGFVTRNIKMFTVHPHEKETMMFKYLLPHVNLHQLTEMTGHEQTSR